MNFHIPDEYVQQTQFPDNDLGLEGDDDDDDGGGTKKDTKWMRQKIERGEVWGKDRPSLSLLLIGSTLLNNTAARPPAKMSRRLCVGDNRFCNYMATLLLST